MNTRFTSKIVMFLEHRIVEIIGITIIFLSIFIFLSLASYSPDDPNFLYNLEKTEIKNIFGFKGSATADFILQSIGLMAFILSLNIFIWGVNIFSNKILNNFLPKIFYSILYILSGSVATSIYREDSFSLFGNGNGGFVGRLSKEFILNNTNLNENFYFLLFLIFLTIIFFALSINLKFSNIINSTKFIIFLFKKLFRKKIIDLTSDRETIFDAKQDLVSEKKVKEQPSLPFQTKKESIVKKKSYSLPLINFLEKNLTSDNLKNESENSNKQTEFLEKVLLDFGVEGKIKRISHGPVVTLYEFEPAAGVKVSKIINLADDIARHTSSFSTRVAIIPGKNTVGIEIPNSQRNNVFLSEIISDLRFKKNEIKLPIALGKSISGVPIVGDLTAMPHLLIAGTTGSGKSVCINTIILSILYKHSPEKCKLILIDPKMLELSAYEGVPHLLTPVITEAKKARSALGWIVKEMEERYKQMAEIGVRNIDGYNSKTKNIMPYVVLIVDEMSDLMLVAGKEIENHIQKLSQMARAAGIHIIMATQRPSVDVITGTIKANFPTRISFQVSSKIDSRTVLGEQGAEQLLGNGDMLFMSSAHRIVRIHGPYVSESEIEKVNSFLRSQAEPIYIDDITGYEEQDDFEEYNGNEKKDGLYVKAIELVKSEGKASTSFLQRKLQIGYNRAARIIDMMEEDGIVSQANHVGKREIL